VIFSAQLTICRDTPVIPEGDYQATVKLSKGAGTPGRWPDVLGLALRIRRPASAGPCDVLFSSAGDGPLTRWLPMPARDWGRTRYGTLAPYATAGRWWWLMLTPSGRVGHASLQELEERPPYNLSLHISGGTAPWLEVGRLALHDLLDDAGVVFDPVLNHPHDALPAPGWLRKIRELAYSGSRAGRGCTGQVNGCEPVPGAVVPTPGDSVDSVPLVRDG
jgi:hypothetical protein